MKRLLTALVWGWIIVVMSGCAGSDAGSGTALNILMVSLDTLRADHVGAWGYPVPVSPCLDAWSRRGVVVSDVLAQSATTRTSHRAVFISRYVSWQEGIESPPEETLAGVLRAAGWDTAAFVDGGKMNRIYGNSPGFEVYDDDGGGFRKILPRAKDWLFRPERRSSGKPFFLFLHTYDIHSPYDPPPPYDRFFTGDVRPGFRTKGMNPPYYNKLKLTAADYRYLRGLYDGGIRWTDGVLADFLRMLQDTGILDNTIVVIMSDHGESLGERHRVGHHQLYRTQTHVPLWISVPGMTPGVLGGPAENIDIAPTILDRLGVSPPQTFQGMSLSDLFPGVGPGRMKDRFRLSEERGRAVVSPDDWKYIVRETPDKDELYDMMNDPEETRNLSDRYASRQSLMMSWLEKRLDKAEPEVRKPIFHGYILLGGAGKGKDGKLKKQLHELGYVQ